MVQIEVGPSVGFKMSKKPCSVRMLREVVYWMMTESLKTSPKIPFMVSLLAISLIWRCFLSFSRNTIVFLSVINKVSFSVFPFSNLQSFVCTVAEHSLKEFTMN